MTMKPFAVQGNITIAEELEIALPSGYDTAVNVYFSEIATLTMHIQEWEDSIYTATGVYTIPPRYKRADYTLYDKLMKTSNENGWEWASGYNPNFPYYDLHYVTAPPLNVVNQALVVKQQYANVHNLIEQFKIVGPQGPGADAVKALQIAIGGSTAQWVFDLDNTWSQANFTTVKQGRLTLPNGATITSSQLPELLAAREEILSYNNGWHSLCDEYGAARDRANKTGGAYTAYFWENTDLLDSVAQTHYRTMLTDMWQAQNTGTFTHLPITSSFYNQMRSFLALDKFSAYESLLASTTVTVGNYSFTFRSNDGALLLPEGGAIKSTTDSSIASAETLYNNALALWDSYKSIFITEAADSGITQQGWPFIGWNVTGLNAQTYLNYVNDAWNIQNTPPSSPPSPNTTLLFIPAISITKYDNLVSSITGVLNTYTDWQNLQKGVDIVANTTKLSVLADDKLQVPGIIQTDAEEDIIIRTRYSGTSSPPSGSGSLTYLNRDWKFGTDSFLTFPDGTRQSTAYDGNLASSIKLGWGAGSINQSTVDPVAVGNLAGYQNQGDYAISVGSNAGALNQGARGIAIGVQSGESAQGAGAIAIGSRAGTISQGANAIAIGKEAGFSNQAASSIIINATGSMVYGNAAGFHVAPVRNQNTSNNILTYDTATNEITYRNDIRSEGEWTVTTGTNNYSFTVTSSGTYVMWVRGTTDNGVISWNATVTLTNDNLPAVGQQQAYAYSGAGTLLDFTSLPSQIIGAAGSVTRSVTLLGTPVGAFEFGINNTSGSSVTVYWGWTKI